MYTTLAVRLLWLIGSEVSVSSLTYSLLAVLKFLVACLSSNPFLLALHSFFDLNANERCLGFMYMGKFDHTTLAVKERMDMALKVEWLV